MKGRLQVVQEFVEAANRAPDVAALHGIIEDASREFGIAHFALLHHVDLRAPPAGAIRLDNYPQPWVEQIVDKRFYLHDPVLSAALNSAAGFSWWEIPSIIKMTAVHQEIFRCAAQEGLSEGFTVPVHVPGELSGSCSFAGKAGISLDDKIKPALQLLGPFAFEAARRLQRRLAKKSSPDLTGRQRDCVILVAQGKSDGVVGQLLGISGETVHKHIESAKAKLGVATRAQLIVKALYDRSITFQEAMEPP